jgi:hypothetical protein
MNAHIWERSDHDWYVEPERCTAQLLTVERFPGWSHDPCCGGGNIVRTLNSHGFTTTGSDIIQRVSDAPWFLGVSDFLHGPNGLFGADNCIFNPPFYRARGAEACIRRALELAPGKVAAFVEKRFTGSETRANGLFREHPPSREWEVTPRPSCPPGAYLQAGGKPEGGKVDFVWLVWDAKPERRKPGELAQKGWLR